MAVSLPVVGAVDWMWLIIGILFGAFILPWVRARIGM